MIIASVINFHQLVLTFVDRVSIVIKKSVDHHQRSVECHQQNLECHQQNVDSHEQNVDGHQQM